MTMLFGYVGHNRILASQTDIGWVYRVECANTGRIIGESSDIFLAVTKSGKKLSDISTYSPMKPLCPLGTTPQKI